ncbi:unnamed protein product [Ceutorhynchus assimilis]|uniref:PX domain-containing protein n=1 Tax=Ceutorhynchus assimilis TaxID=467358 RepID=A0A9N9ME17_9CUCU|nr:unnamed protein product [Ceutorhynchus assimilis]
MHFSIPDTQELKEANGSTFIGYNIHINGAFHCTLRYKQMHNLNEQLKKEFANDYLPPFPPKKLLPLTSGQLEERRILLEKYIQTVGQDSKFVSSELLCGFFLSAQQESSRKRETYVNLKIYTFNYYPVKTRIRITTSSFDSTEKVLIKTLKQINLPIEYNQYFSLYLIKIENSSDIVVVRKLFDFESPYLTQQVLRSPTKIVIRKSYWDTIYDNEIMKDPVALNLLYKQILSEIERGSIHTTPPIKVQLEKLKLRLAKKEYILFAQKQKDYGFMQFAQCYSDFPKPQTKVSVAIGDKELRIRLLDQFLYAEDAFKVTRMRCWRITTTNNKSPIHLENGHSTQVPSNLELSFEYLKSKDKLEWITINSDQAILMSVCLRSLVEELLMKKNGFKKPNSFKSSRKWTYMKRDGTCQCITINNDLNNSDDQGSQSDHSYAAQEPFSMKTLQENFSSVLFKNGREFIENHAFEGIGDEDL